LYPLTETIADNTGNIRESENVITLAAGRYYVSYLISETGAVAGTLGIVPLVNGRNMTAYRAEATVTAGEDVSLSGAFLLQASAGDQLSFLVNSTVRNAEASAAISIIKVQ